MIVERLLQFELTALFNDVNYLWLRSTFYCHGRVEWRVLHGVRSSWIRAVFPKSENVIFTMNFGIRVITNENGENAAILAAYENTTQTGMTMHSSLLFCKEPKATTESMQHATNMIERCRTEKSSVHLRHFDHPWRRRMLMSGKNGRTARGCEANRRGHMFEQPAKLTIYRYRR
jgi:hypothetical protein